MMEIEKTSFESRISPNQNLTFRYLTSVIRKRNPDLHEVIASSRGLVNDEGKFTNLAMILSDQCTHTIKIAAFKGNNKRTLLGQKEIGGSAIRQIVVSCMLIESLSGARDVYTSNGAVIRKDFPTIAVKEAITNAVVHRDYNFSGSTIVNIFDNRMEVLSVGGIAPELSAEAIQLGISQSRNEGLAKIMSDLKVMFSLGTGFSKIKAEYTGQKIAPEIVTTKGAFKVVLPNTNFGSHEGVKIASKQIEKIDTPEEVEAKFKAALNAALAEREAKEEADAVGKNDAGSLFDNVIRKADEQEQYPDVFDETSSAGNLDELDESSVEYESSDDAASIQTMDNIQYNKIMKFIDEHGSIKRRQAQLILDVGQSRALTVLSGMQEAGLIRLVGIGRTSEYIRA